MARPTITTKAMMYVATAAPNVDDNESNGFREFRKLATRRPQVTTSDATRQAAVVLMRPDG